MTDSNFRAMLDGDHECVEDVAPWMATLDESAFGKQVDKDVHGRLDQVAAAALREPVNLDRWQSALKAITIALQTQLSDPVRKGPGHTTWRQRVLTVQEVVVMRREECRRLLIADRRPTAEQLKARESKAADRDARRDAWGRAARRLENAHRAEYLALLIEELESDGLSVPAGVLEELRTLRQG